MWKNGASHNRVNCRCGQHCLPVRASDSGWVER
jgi:hypothetical protein